MGNPFCCSGHTFHHIPPCVGEPNIIFKEITMGKNMCDDELVLDKRIRIEQKGITRIGIDDKLVYLT